MLRRNKIDVAIGSALVVGAFAIYLSTLAPTVATIFDDSLEFQVVLPSLGIAHPTGYPLYTIGGWIFTHILPIGDMAYRTNLFSAVGAAIAVGFLYLSTLEFTKCRTASLGAAAAFAVSPVFWSQATIAEVYSWQMALMAAWIWSALKWAKAPKNADKWLLWLALTTGLLLAHHRMSVLLFPSLAYWLWEYRSKVGKPWKPIEYLLLPIASYLYIPLRGMTTSSLDGSYHNTLEGFIKWTMASNYGIFFEKNPFNVHYTPAFFARLWVHSFGWVGLAFGLLGIILLWRERKTWTFLMLALLLNLAFAFTYKVADIQVFFLPSFLLFTMLIGEGLTVFKALGWKAASTLIPLLFLLQPASIAKANWQQMDRSDSWQVYDYAVDVMHQPMPKGSVIVGLLGEKTLFTYMQKFHGMRKDLAIFAEDDPKKRLSLVTDLVNQRKHVFLTRKLDGIQERFPLSCLGPLIQVLEPGASPNTGGMIRVGKRLYPQITLLGYRMKVLDYHSGQRARVTLFWKTDGQVKDDLKVSARLFLGGKTAFSVDDWPVHRAYPTRYWREGEVIADCYDLEPPSTGYYTPVLILYRARDAKETGRVQLPPVYLKH